MECYMCRYWESWNDDEGGYYGYCRNPNVPWKNTKRYEMGEGCAEGEFEGTQKVEVPALGATLEPQPMTDRERELMELIPNLENQLNALLVKIKRIDPIPVTEEEINNTRALVFTFCNVSSMSELVVDLRRIIYAGTRVLVPLEQEFEYGQENVGNLWAYTLAQCVNLAKNRLSYLAQWQDKHRPKHKPAPW